MVMVETMAIRAAVVAIVTVVMYDFTVKPVVLSVVFHVGPHVHTIFIIIPNCWLSFSVLFSLV